MKSAGTHTIAALQSGQFYKAELYDIQLQNGVVIRFTDYDLPLTWNGSIYPSNLIVKRGTMTQKVGFSVDTLSLELAPQIDSTATSGGGVGTWDFSTASMTFDQGYSTFDGVTSGAAPTSGGGPQIAGLSILQAARQGYFDGAAITMRKVFMQAPTTPGALPTNTNNEAVLWWTGIVSQADGSRLSLSLSCVSNLQQLNVQMPRNLVQTGCTHTLFNAGCTLLKSTYTSSGSITGAVGTGSINTSLTQATNYFNLGVITFTSGALNGVSFTVAQSLVTGGNLQMVAPFNKAPAVGDTFTIYPGCDKTLNTCKTKFASDNSAHFRGAPWVPVPETLYSGGEVAGPAATLGRQGGQGTGSPYPGRGPGRYRA